MRINHACGILKLKEPPFHGHFQTRGMCPRCPKRSRRIHLDFTRRWWSWYAAVATALRAVQGVQLPHHQHAERDTTAHKAVTTANTVTRLIAKLVGILDRKGDGSGGAKTLWLVGMNDLAGRIQRRSQGRSGQPNGRLRLTATGSATTCGRNILYFRQ